VGQPTDNPQSVQEPPLPHELDRRILAPPRLPPSTDSLAHVYRGEFIKKYGYAIPNKEALERIASYGPLLEIGAGAFYVALL
jgi:hypothetical protein